MRTKPQIPDAPGLGFRPRSNHWVAVWVARPDLVKRGFAPRTQRLWPPSDDPLCPLDGTAEALIRSECYRLQNQMLRWSHHGPTPPGAVIHDGTLGSLMRAYMADADSPFQRLRFQSRRTYGVFISIIDKVVGRRVLASIEGRDFVRWFEKWSEPTRAGAPERLTRAHSMITILRIVFSFGVAFGYDRPACLRLKQIISEMTFRNGRSRRVELTAEQAVDIRAAAWAMDRPSIALGQALQFELLLRQKDVVGEWVPISEPGMSDVTTGGLKWVCGIDWRQISPDLILTHTLSKSLRGRNALSDKSSGKVKAYDLKLYPMVMEELNRLPLESRVGPVIKDERTGLPYRQNVYGRWWRRVAEQAGIPVEIQNRDSRAGGITEGIEASDGDMEAARNAAGHSQVATTRIYNRGGDRQTAKMATLRAAKRKPNATSNDPE